MSESHESNAEIFELNLYGEIEKLELAVSRRIGRMPPAIIERINAMKAEHAAFVCDTCINTAMYNYHFALALKVIIDVAESRERPPDCVVMRELSGCVNFHESGDESVKRDTTYTNAEVIVNFTNKDFEIYHREERIFMGEYSRYAAQAGSFVIETKTPNEYIIISPFYGINLVRTPEEIIDYVASFEEQIITENYVYIHGIVFDRLEFESVIREQRYDTADEFTEYYYPLRIRTPGEFSTVSLFSFDGRPQL